MRNAESTSASNHYHESIHLEKILHILNPGPDRLFLDATLGGGGHTAALLHSGADVIGIDRDIDSLDYVGQSLTNWLASGKSGSRHLRIKHANFAEIATILKAIGRPKFDGILLDLGLSSHQIKQTGRGFSFDRDGPLDMRMDQSQRVDAAEWLRKTDPCELSLVIQGNADVPHKFATRIAESIKRDNNGSAINTTGNLVKLIKDALPVTESENKHIVARVFQAIRMAVNAEISALHTVLICAPKYLRTGGRIVVLTFHSIEDQIVKRYLWNSSLEWKGSLERSFPRPHENWMFRQLGRHPTRVADSELRDNFRARTAKLRWAEKIHHTGK